eukprot:1821531-Prymnesium_polylepis.1
MKAGLKGFHLPHQLDSESNVVLNGRRRSVSDVTNVLNRGSITHGGTNGWEGNRCLPLALRLERARPPE